MNVVFLSSYLNHHQRPLSDALAARCGYTFLMTGKMPQHRRSLGWEEESLPEYALVYDADPERGEEVLRRADVIIAGAAREELVRPCVLRGQLVLRYTERPLKKGLEPLKFLPRLLKWHWQNPGRKPIYLLSAGAYAAADYARFGLFRGKALRWGYFPEVKPRLPEGKRKATILWAGRFLDWKSPMDAVLLASRLKKAGLDFHLTMIGDGPLASALRERIAAEGLEQQVQLTGPMKPQQVRRAMEESEIFLFTSGRQEGWGVVLSEAMASGCAVVASAAAGATPYLVRSGENGLVYPHGNVEELTDRVKALLQTPGLARKLGRGAYETMAAEWNPETAARRLLEVARGILEDGTLTVPWPDGPCSRADGGDEK